MELKYWIARWNNKHALFLISAKEEMELLERLQTENTDFWVFVSGIWAEDAQHHAKFNKWVNKVEYWVVGNGPITSEFLSEMACKAHLSGTEVIDLDTFFLRTSVLVPATSSELNHLLSSKGVHQDLWIRTYLGIKYALEPLVALSILIAFSPILLFVAIAVKFTSAGPIIYSQERVGLNGRVFRIYKFRSMLVDSERGVPTWSSTSKTDPNLTPIGTFLRGSHLDELPQLWNIVRGEVSFIGPRPERPEFVAKLSESIPLFKLRTLLKPGISGWAQIHQGYANTVEDSKKKLELDFYYLMKHSPSLDFKIVLKTLSVLTSGGTEQIKRARANRSRLSLILQKVLKPVKVTP